MRKFLNVVLVAMMIFGITAGTVAMAHSSSDVITSSDAGGGELTGRDIGIILLILAGIALLIIIL